METLPLTEVKVRLSAIVDDVVGTHERVSITRHGRPEAVLIAADDLAELEETLAWLTAQGARERVAVAEADVAAGRAMTTAQMLAAARESHQDPEA